MAQGHSTRHHADIPVLSQTVVDILYRTKCRCHVRRRCEFVATVVTNHPLLLIDIRQLNSLFHLADVRLIVMIDIADRKTPLQRRPSLGRDIVVWINVSVALSIHHLLGILPILIVRLSRRPGALIILHKPNVIIAN